jgi:hypothetical protein
MTESAHRATPFRCGCHAYLRFPANSGGCVNRVAKNLSRSLHIEEYSLYVLTRVGAVMNCQFVLAEAGWKEFSV